MDRTAEEDRIVHHDHGRPCRYVWGLIPRDVAQAEGALAAVSSVCFTPEVRRDVLAAARAEIPEHVIPRCDDTVANLVDRLSASDWLDDLHVLHKGNGTPGKEGMRVRLNATTYPQPRRKAWSDEDGEGRLYMYTDFGRLPCDYSCSTMPPAVANLRDELYQAAFPFLGETSRGAGKPNSVQLLLYYTAFNSRIGRHRDNYTVRHLRRMLQGNLDARDGGSPMGGEENSQLLQSDVIIYSMGNEEMIFKMSFPPRGHEHTATLKEHVTSDMFTLKLKAGSLLVYKFPDDLHYAHECHFEECMRHEMGIGGWRAAWVMRYLTVARQFDPSTHKLVTTEQHSVRDEERMKARLSKKKRMLNL